MAVPTLFIKAGRVFVARKEVDLELVEEGWEPVARFKSEVLAMRAARWYAERFEYIIEWG
ncbi:hypothetical protein CGL52_10220 [Pyrobaculum aerophilum]|uniref:Uncharacterized protein n=1 Tax=Pyrobaculum aerophilum TaxID=13773 RepID=A0A371R0W9_9CREN|nr:hypothetical protein CGL52_10220 [Pyrobaculum aerophilum]